MQEQVCKERADDPTLRRSRGARHDAAILHLHRRLQPALDVEPHPRAVRMMTDRLEQQLPIDAVEVTFDVDVEHPVERLCLAPGLLPSPVGPWPRLNNAAPSVQLHYRAF